MTRLYAMVDVNLPEDPAIVAVGADAEHLYIRSILLAKRIMTDGVIHRLQAERIAADFTVCHTGDTTPQQLCARLVDADLWHREGDHYRITGWLKWNKPADEIRAAEEAEQARKKAWRDKKKAEQAGSDDPETRRERDASRDRRGDASSERRATDSNATRSESKSKSKSKSKSESEGGGVGGEEHPPTRADAPKHRGSRIPDPFFVTDDMVAWAAQHHPGFDWAAETIKFKDHWLAAPSSRGVKADWPACWRNWIRRAASGEFR